MGELLEQISSGGPPEIEIDKVRQAFPDLYQALLSTEDTILERAAQFLREQPKPKPIPPYTEFGHIVIPICRRIPWSTPTDRDQWLRSLASIMVEWPTGLPAWQLRDTLLAAGLPESLVQIVYTHEQQAEDKEWEYRSKFRVYRFRNHEIAVDMDTLEVHGIDWGQSGERPVVYITPDWDPFINGVRPRPWVKDGQTVEGIWRICRPGKITLTRDNICPGIIVSERDTAPGEHRGVIWARLKRLPERQYSLDVGYGEPTVRIYNAQLDLVDQVPLGKFLEGKPYRKLARHTPDLTRVHRLID